MAVPSRRESGALLLSPALAAWPRRHARAGAEIAGWLAWRAKSAGLSLDRRLVEAAALLHDVDKLTRVKQQIDGLAHADGSAAWLASQGYPELGPAIVGHPVTRLAAAARVEGWVGGGFPPAPPLGRAAKAARARP